MSFFKCLVTILGTVNLQLEDEEVVRKAFQEQFGADGERFGLEDLEEGIPEATYQLENVARLLDCRVRVMEEASTNTQPPAKIVKVFNPAGTQQGWARWKSSAHDEIEPMQRFTFGSLSRPPAIISVGGDLLKDLGWPDLLKSLIRCRGELSEALFLMKEDLNQEMEASAGDNPVITEKVSRLDKILRKLEEDAQLQAEREQEETLPPSMPTSPRSVPLSNKGHPFYSPVTKTSTSTQLQSISPVIGTPSSEQAFLERIMEASVNNNVHSMVSVGNLPTLSNSSLSAIETFSKEYFTTIASKTFNSANKSLHPIRGLTADNYQVMQLIWTESC